jgi:hypothetical protein
MSETGGFRGRNKTEEEIKKREWEEILKATSKGLIWFEILLCRSIKP